MAERSNTTRASKPMTVEEVSSAVGVYPLEAYTFLQAGLHYTVEQVAGGGKKGHVTGHQLTIGLREFAQLQWGIMARAVLTKWNVTCTYDFGRIVFALVDAGIFSVTEGDSVEDFRGVYDFAEFDSAYRVESKL